MKRNHIYVFIYIYIYITYCLKNFPFKNITNPVLLIVQRHSKRCPSLIGTFFNSVPPASQIYSRFVPNNIRLYLRTRCNLD